MSVSDFRKSSAALIVGTVTNSLAIGGVTISSNASPGAGWVLVSTGSNSAIWRDGVAFGSNANDVSSFNHGGASSSNSRADHVHRGLSSLSHASNTFYGGVTFTTPGNTVGITSPAAGTFAFTAPIGSGGGTPSDQTGHEYDYVEFTASVNVTATTEGGADTIVTSNAVVYSGTTPVLIEFFCPRVAPRGSVAADFVAFYLYDGAASIGQLSLVQDPAGAAMRTPIRPARRLTPSAGSHTYSVRAFVNAGTGVVEAGVGGLGNVVPGFIRITQV